MKIRFLEGPYKGNEYEFTSSCVTIGRDGGNQLVLDTDGVSRCHAELKQNADGSWIVCDLNSTNGVKVGGSRIDGTHPVSDNSQLVIGENLIEISQLSQEPARVIFNPIISTPPPAPVFKQESAPSPSSPAPSPAAAAPRPVSMPASQASSGAGAAEKSAPHSQGAAETGKGKSAPLTSGGIDIGKLSGSLFGKKGEKQTVIHSFSAVENKESDPKKKRSNLIFYTILVCVVVMVLSSAFSIMNPSRPKKSRSDAELPLVLRYEKEIFSKNNVFRFDFQVRSTMVKTKSTKTKDQKSSGASYQREYSVVFTIDDIASSRHFTREVSLSDATVEELRRVIRSSGIYAREAEKAAREHNVKRRLTIVDGSRLLDTAVVGEYASTEFNIVEEAVINVAETFGLKTIAMTPEELVEMAKKCFINAEDYYDNRRAAATNLREAIRNYKVTVESLEQFSPKPPLWDRARLKLAEAVKERDQTLDALETEYRRLAQQRNFEAMKTTFKQIMDLTDPESRQHNSARRRLIYIEQALRKRK